MIKWKFFQGTAEKSINEHPVTRVVSKKCLVQVSGHYVLNDKKGTGNLNFP
jgi:hypothetical protein